MTLLVDIGNTALSWATVDGGALDDTRSVRHGGGLPIDLLADWDALAPPARVLVGNVGGPALGESVARAVWALWGLEAEFVRTQAEGFGVRVAYAEPARLGVDRWLALIAARALGVGPWLIVDAGTAVTYDLLLGEGLHLGGLILPGLGLMRRALLAETALPPTGDRPSQDPGSESWAVDTDAALVAGPRQAVAALADRLYDRLGERAGVAPQLLLTGGDAEVLASCLGRPGERVPNLVLRGLARLARETRA